MAGTSAGSVVGAQVVSGTSLEDFYAVQLEPADHEIGAGLSQLSALKLVWPFLLPGSLRDRGALRYRPCGRRSNRRPLLHRRGMRSSASVHLVRGAERVDALAPRPRSLSNKASIRAQLESVVPREWSVITPDAEALAAFGRNLLDPTTRAVDAAAGLRQSQGLVAELRHVWFG